MPSTTQTLDLALSEFDARRTDLGRLMRYREERLSQFFRRCALVVFGCVVLSIMVDHRIGLGALAIYTIVEAADTYVHLRLPKIIESGVSVRRAMHITFAGAFLQTFGVCAFIFLTWFHVPRESAIILCLSILGGSAVNSITSMPLNRLVGIMRLCLDRKSVV